MSGRNRHRPAPPGRHRHECRLRTAAGRAALRTIRSRTTGREQGSGVWLSRGGRTVGERGVRRVTALSPGNRAGPGNPAAPGAPAPRSGTDPASVGRAGRLGAAADRRALSSAVAMISSLSATTTGCARSRTSSPPRPHRPVFQRLHLDSSRSRPGSRLGYRVPLRGAITDATPPTGGKSAYEFKAQQESSPART